MTDNPKFQLDPNVAPEDNSITIHGREGRKGLYTAKDVEPWISKGYTRPYVAEIHIDEDDLNSDDIGGRFHGEKFIPNHLFNKIKVNRVIPLDAHAREKHGMHGWIEGVAGREFDTGKPTPKHFDGYNFRGYKYNGKDVRHMSPEETGKLKQHFDDANKTGNLGKSEPISLEDLVKRADDLTKGVRQRQWPVNPLNETSAGDLNNLREWTKWGVNRNEIPELTGNARKRGLFNLAGATKSRMNDKGEREYLLHRGIGGAEEKHININNGQHADLSSWTPSYKVANDFAQIYANNRKNNEPRPEKPVLSSWVPESAIHHVPNQVQPNQFKEEHEIIVKPHPMNRIEGFQPESDKLNNAINTRKRGGILTDQHIKRSLSNVPPPPMKKSEAYDKLRKMGMKGDWKKEGYKIELHGGGTEPDAYVMFNGNQVGRLTTKDLGNGNIKATSVLVDAAHRRKGLATAMYQHIEQNTGKKFTPSTGQYDDGKALWSQQNRPFGKSEPIELEELVKRSKNVREQTRNITSEQAKQRRLQYANSIGLNPIEVEERDGAFPSSSDELDAQGDNETLLGYNDKFQIEHETAHAMMTPKNMSIRDYFDHLASGKTKTSWDMGRDYENHVDESVANAAESMIDRRAGVGRWASTFRNRQPLSDVLGSSKEDPNHEETPHGKTFEDKYYTDFPAPPAKSGISGNAQRQRDLKPFKAKAAEAIEQFDQGAKFTPEGTIKQPTGINAKINARSKEKIGKSEPISLEELIKRAKSL